MRVSELTKRCGHCKKLKKSHGFYIHKKTGKLFSWCKECLKKAQVKYSTENRELIRRKDYLAYHNMTVSKKESRRKYEKKKLLRLNNTAEGRMKLTARSMARHAVRQGKIKKRKCKVCGKKAQIHHHKGYEREHWYDVRWLCPIHHKKAHRKLKEQP